jgi:hypothetical protein
MSTSRQVDQVVRRAEFSEAHPEVDISYDREARQWNASWPQTGKISPGSIKHFDLRGLLDRLSDIFQ